MPDHRDTLEGRLDLEQQRGSTGVGVGVGVARWIPAMNGAIRHDRTNGALTRSLMAYGH